MQSSECQGLPQASELQNALSRMPCRLLGPRGRCGRGGEGSFLSKGFVDWLLVLLIDLTLEVLQVLSLAACGSGLRARGCYGLWIPG